MFKTIKENVVAEIIEKKSKFIANLIYVQNIEEAEEIIKQTKKKYYDARHNCFAFCISTQDGIIKKSSDDGEPSGTAGAPMLNIIEKNGLCNVLVIITRYFGGILLGTGGLVRAYSDATLKALEMANFAIEETGMELAVEIQYPDLENFKYYCRKNGINIINTEYDKNIKCFIEVNEQEKNSIIENTDRNSIKIIKYEIIKQKNIRKNDE